MIVANDITIDGRVKKTGASVSALGYEVTFVGLSTGARHVGKIGSIPAVWVHSAKIFENANRQGARSGSRQPVEYSLARARIKLRLRHLASDPAVALPRSAGRRSRFPVVIRRLRNKAQRKLLVFKLSRVDRRFAQTKARSQAIVALDEHGARKAASAVWNARLNDYEMAYGPELDRLDPEILHVHDVHLLGVAARYRNRRKRTGRTVQIIYDAHEYVRGQRHIYGASHEALIQLEQEHIGSVDEILTVSPVISEWLARDYAFPRERIGVTLNTPTAAVASRHEDTPSLRNALGLAADVPLIVYSGGQSEARGVTDLVDAVALVDGVHCALVANSTNKFVLGEAARARRGGWGDRIHVAPFVLPHEVPSYLNSADVAIHPLRRYLEISDGQRILIENHEAALTNKLFEYLHAKLPVVSSDCAVSAEFVTTHKIGRVFPAGDVQRLADAIRATLKERSEHRAHITPELLAKYTWQEQTDAIASSYQRLGGRASDDGSLEVRSQLDGLLASITVLAEGRAHQNDSRNSAQKNVLIGPLNTAGQAYLWANSVRRFSPHFAWSESLENKKDYEFDTDSRISASAYNSISWQVQRLQTIPSTYTHLLLESGFGPLGSLNGGRLVADIGFLQRHLEGVAAVFHGSDIRDPREHARREPHSPFLDDQGGLTARLQERVLATRAEFDSFPGYLFCSTPDLLLDLDDSCWLPVVVDVELFEAKDVRSADGPPSVLFSPTRSGLKGAEVVDHVLSSLDEQGAIRYQRSSGIPHEELVNHIRESAIVIDQLRIGAYGVTAVEGLAAGKVVVGHVSDVVRDMVPCEIPIVEANPDNFAAVIRETIEDLPRLNQDAHARVAYAKRFHDGRCSSRQIEIWLTGGKPDRVPDGPTDRV